MALPLLLPFRRPLGANVTTFIEKLERLPRGRKVYWADGFTTDELLRVAVMLRELDRLTPPCYGCLEVGLPTAQWVRGMMAIRPRE